MSPDRASVDVCRRFRLVGEELVRRRRDQFARRLALGQVRFRPLPGSVGGKLTGAVGVCKEGIVVFGGQVGDGAMSGLSNQLLAYPFRRGTWHAVQTTGPRPRLRLHASVACTECVQAADDVCWGPAGRRAAGVQRHDGRVHSAQRQPRHRPPQPHVVDTSGFSINCCDAL